MLILVDICFLSFPSITFADYVDVGPCEFNQLEIKNKTIANPPVFAVAYKAIGAVQTTASTPFSYRSSLSEKNKYYTFANSEGFFIVINPGPPITGYFYKGDAKGNANGGKACTLGIDATLLGLFEGSIGTTPNNTTTGNPLGSKVPSTSNPAGGGIPAAPNAPPKESPPLPADSSFNTLLSRKFLEDPSFSWVLSGWTFLRQLSNIAVVVFLFIGSVMTTLNLSVSTYGIKRVLPAIIIAAILANFSFFIIKIFIAFNESLTAAFSGRVTGDTMWGSMTAPLRNIIDDYYVKIDQGWSYYLKSDFVALLMFVYALGLLLLYGLYLIRDYIVGFLIILAPLAFIAMAMPFSQSLFKKWWSETLRWVFLPTIATFWIFIAVMIDKKLSINASANVMPVVIMAIPLYMAIRTPFMLGGAVAAVGGFIAGQTWGRAKPTLQTEGKILAQLTPGIGHISRYSAKRTQERQQRLKNLESGPVALGRYKLTQEQRDAKGFNAGARRLWYGFMTGLDRGRGRAKVNLDTQGREGALTMKEYEAEATNSPHFKSRIGDLAVAEENVEKAMSAITAEAKTSALATNKLAREERALLLLRQKAAENRFKTVDNQMQTEALTPGGKLYGSVEARLKKMGILEETGKLSELLGQSGMKAKSSEEQLQTVLDMNQLAVADKNIRSHNLIQRIQQGKVNYSSLTPEQQKELLPYLESELENSGVEVSKGRPGMSEDDRIRENAHRYMGVESGSGITDPDRLREMNAAFEERKVSMNKMIGFQGQLSSDRQKVQRDYFTPEQWRQTIRENYSDDAIANFLGGKTQIGHMEDYSGNAITDVDKHNNALREIHDRFNAAFSAVKTLNFDDPEFLSSVGALMSMLHQGGQDGAYDRAEVFKHAQIVENKSGTNPMETRRDSAAMIKTILTSSSIADMIGAKGISRRYGSG